MSTTLNEDKVRRVFRLRVEEISFTEIQKGDLFILFDGDAFYEDGTEINEAVIDARRWVDDEEEHAVKVNVLGKISKSIATLMKAKSA